MNAYYVTTREAKKILGVNEDTLRKWADNGLFPSIKTPGGHRLYSISQFLNRTEEKNSKENICYCRVSSQGQRDDLQRQIQYMQEKFPEHKIISDIGSGINFKRKGLRSILEMASKGLINEVVVAYRDRLCRFAFELVEWILHLNGVKLMVLNKEMESSKSNELAEDLLAIINVFNCRVNGRRKYKGNTENKERKTYGQQVEKSSFTSET